MQSTILYPAPFPNDRSGFHFEPDGGWGWRVGTETAQISQWSPGSGGSRHFYFARFGLDMSAETSIRSATLELYRYQIFPPFTLPAQLVFRIVDPFDCPLFSDGNYADPSEVGLAGSYTKTPTYTTNKVTVDIQDILQDYVNDGGFSSGSYLGLRIEPIETYPVENSVTVQFYTADYSVRAQWPRLIIEWGYGLSVQSTPPQGINISYTPTPDDTGTASPQATNFNLEYDKEAELATTAATDPSGYRWLYWDFGGGDTRANKTQEFTLDEDKTVIATYEQWAAGLAVLQAEPRKPVWIYEPHDAALYEAIHEVAGENSILAEAANLPSAWLQQGGRRYVAFGLDADIQYIYYDGTWSSPVTIRADRTDPAALMLEPSRDVFVVCLSGNDLKLNVLRWDGAAETYSVDSEIDMGATANSTGGMWLAADGTVHIAFTDTADDLQTLSSDLSGESWS